MYLRFKGVNGDVVEAEISEFLPLSYEDLFKLKVNKNQSNVLKIKAKSNKHTLNGETTESSYEIKSSVTFPHQVSIFALVDGGWLPPPFVIPKLFMVDRNVVSTLKKLNNGTTRIDHAATKWWLEFLRNKEVIINPALYALEGYEKKAPARPQFIAAYDEAVIEIKKSLPDITVVNYQGVHYKAAYSIIKGLGERFSREAAFLSDAVPLIHERVSSSKLSFVRDQIFSLMDRYSVTSSFSVLAVLSCLYESDKELTYPTARKILKTKKKYSIRNAYNALNDLRAIELLVASRGAVKESFSLCTQDKALALFWCGLLPTLDTFEGGKVTINFNFSKVLFPRLAENSVNDLRLMLNGHNC